MNSAYWQMRYQNAQRRIAEMEAERDQLRDKVRQYDLMCDRISALHSERDMMKFSSDRLVIAFDAMKAERDELREQNAALAARNAELYDVAEILLCIDQCETCKTDGEFNRDAVKRVIKREAPQSLARIREEAKAETLDRLLENQVSFCDTYVRVSDIEAQRDEYHQQADGEL